MPRRGFASVHDARVGAGHGPHVAVGRGGDSAHPLHEVQRRALRPQDRRGGTVNAGDVSARFQRSAVFQQQVHVQIRIDPAEDCGGHIASGQHAGSLGPQHPAADDAGGNQGLRRWVVEHLILGEGGVDEVQNLRGQLLAHVVLANSRVVISRSLPLSLPRRSGRRNDRGSIIMAIAFYRHLIPKTPKPFVLSLSKDKNLPSYARI